MLREEIKHGSVYLFGLVHEDGQSNTHNGRADITARLVKPLILQATLSLPLPLWLF